MSATQEVLHAVLGTAGHIDHGKSSLVRALTGTDPDRFREEQERGMTIDIGFAEYRTRSGVDVGLIDVPGHERFIRNMVAGVVGMDMVMLVVAADDSVMPQTREHLEIMSLLGIRRGFVVITKVDMVEEELVELVEEELAEFLQGTFLEGSPILRASSVTGEGLEALKATIDELVEGLPARDLSGVFRLPVQRSFTIKGHGTVVTGVPLAGEVSVGESLELLPSGRRCRVRGIQVHHRPAQRGGAGLRTALNLADVSYKEIQRGDVVARPGFFAPARLLEARFSLLPSWKGEVKNNLSVRLHVGCAEVLGSLVLLDRRALEPGGESLVQMRLKEQVVVAPGDRYILRLASPERTLGGGVILGQTRFHFKRFREWIHENLHGKEESLQDRERYLEYVVRSEGLHPVAVEHLAVLVKEPLAEVKQRVERLIQKGRLLELPGGREVLHADMVGRGAKELLLALEHLHGEDHYPFGFSVQTIASRMKHPLPAAALFLERAATQGLVVQEGPLVRLKSFKGNLSQEDRRLLGLIEERLKKARFATPIPQAMAEELGRPRKRIDNILTLLEGWGRIVKLDHNVYLHADAIQEARQLLVAWCQEHGEMPSNKMKDVIGATRKYVIPLLEYFDRIGLTVRKDSVRRLKPGYDKLP